MQMRTTSRLALVLAGAGLALTGTVLLIRAAWGGVALALGPIWAYGLIGAALAVIGAILVATARTAHRPPPPPSPQAALLGAFFEGMRAGRASRTRTH